MCVHHVIQQLDSWGFYLHYLKDWGLKRRDLGKPSSSGSLLMLLPSRNLIVVLPAGAGPAGTRLLLMQKGAAGG